MESVLKIKFFALTGTRSKDFAAELFQEPFAQELLVQPQPGKRLHAERAQRFANVIAAKLLAFEDDHAPSGAREQCRGRAACRSSPNDCDIVHGGAHLCGTLANCPDFDRAAGRLQQFCANIGTGKMKLIDRFISRELIVNVLFAIAVLSLVLVVGNIFRKLLPLLVNHDVPMEYLITFIAYVLPFSLIFTIPWGLLTAILLVFGRLSADNELIALRANGVSVTRVCLPLAVLSVISTVICLWLNVDVAPAAQEKLRSSIFDLATQNPIALFGGDQVIDQFPGRKIYVGKKEGNKLENIIVFQMDEHSLPVRVTHARTGMLETDLPNKRLLLHLYDARYQERDERNPYDLRKIRDGITMT